MIHTRSVMVSCCTTSACCSVQLSFAFKLYEFSCDIAHVEKTFDTSASSEMVYDRNVLQNTLIEI